MIDMEKKSYRLSILVILMISGMALAIAATEQVALTIYVHEGDLNGTMLSGVTVNGKDAEGNSFEGLTDSDGVVTIAGQPGTWQFTFAKEGYEPIDLYYDVIETDEAAAYLLKALESNEKLMEADLPNQSSELINEADEQIAPY
jgi:hypothetical protein